jgi:hypothetical protein
MHAVDRTITVLARMGYAARGFVYLVVGLLSWNAAVDVDDAADVREALQTIFEQRFGVPVLVALAAGLIGYAVWRSVQSLLDVDRHGWSLRGSSVRLGLIVSALVHAGLAWACVEIAFRIGSGEGRPVRDQVQSIMSLPQGDWLIMGLGVAVLIAGVAHIYKGATGGFRKWFEASAAMMRWIDPVSRFGLISRGLIFLIVGGFLLYAGIYVEPEAARGMEGALNWLQDQYAGRWMLGVVSVGLLAFGGYSIIESVVRRIGVAHVL